MKTWICKIWTQYGDLIRFGCVGIFTSGIHYGLYLWLDRYWSANLSYSIGYLTAFVVNFFLTSFYAFKTDPDVKKAIGFIFSNGVNYVVNIGAFNFFLWCGISDWLAPIFGFAIATPIFFLLVRWSFRKK